MVRGKSIKSRRSIHPIFIDKLFGVTDNRRRYDSLHSPELANPVGGSKVIAGEIEHDISTNSSRNGGGSRTHRKLPRRKRRWSRRGGIPPGYKRTRTRFIPFAFSANGIVTKSFRNDYAVSNHSNPHID